MNDDDLKKEQQSEPGSANRQKLAKNIIYSALTASADALLLALLIYSGRVLDIEEFGILSFGLAASTVLTFLVNLGLDSVSIRKISSGEVKASELISWVLIWKFFASVVICTLFLIWVLIEIEEPATRQVIYVLAGAGLMRSFNMTIRAFFQAHEKFALETLAVLVERLTLFILGMSVLLTSADLLLFASIFLVARIIAFIVFWILLVMYVSTVKWGFNFNFTLSLQREALPLAIAIIFSVIYIQLDLLILARFESDANVGVFSAAFKIYEGLLVIPLIVNSVVYPRLSHLYIGDINKHFDLYERLMKYTALISFPFLLAGLSFNEILITKLYGGKYVQAEPIFAVLMISVIFSFYMVSLNTIYRSIARESMIMKQYFVNLIVKLLLDIVFIYYFSIIGAAIAVMLSSLIFFIIAANGLKKSGYNFQSIGIVFLKILSLVLFLVLLNELLNFLPVLLLMVGSLIIYGIAIFNINIFDKYEFDIFYKITKIEWFKKM